MAEISIRYFAWVRERIGQPRDTLTTTAQTVDELVAEISALSPAHELALSDLSALRFALDQTLVEGNTPIGTARELAIFPPMTGG